MNNSECSREGNNIDQKFYSLPMFPYPSGTAMHVGHASNFLVTEIMARYHRMCGYKVVFPIGYDSFGLPTENFAIKNNKSARQATEDNIVYFEEQLKGIDFSFDQDRKFKTSDPEYYKWTQWIFTKLYQHNLVYRKDGLVNWCNGCQTVLANDQVVDGRCERCETEIIQKKHPQWYIKITDYADQLLDYSDCDRPEETKIHQTNWIGKSQGAEIDFVIQGTEQIITVFTTRPDTIYGVTAIVLAPENEIIDQYMTPELKSELANYRKTTALKTNIERQATDKDKTGFDSGVQVIHPLTGDLVPVWFADYVLPDYATGAVMFVPAHDERDWEFAIKYNLDIKEVISKGANGNIGYEYIIKGNHDFDGGSYNGLYAMVTSLGEKTKENILLSGLSLVKDEWNNYKVRGELKGFKLLSKLEGGNCKVELVKEGHLVNSQEFTQPTNHAKRFIIERLESIGKGKAKITYRLRDWSVSRQRYWGSPIPVYYTFEDNDDGRYTADNPHPDKTKWIPHLIPESELPVILPLDLPNYKPAGKSPLEDHPSFKYYHAPDGQVYLRECDTLDTFMCSSFYFLRFCDPHNTQELISPEAAKMMPVDLYVGGKEHTVGHLLYSRFIYKFLRNIGVVACDSKEPFIKLVHQGMVHAHDGRKMSKRWGNVIDPMGIINEYNADTLRTYTMFMGPVEASKNWNPDAVAGIHRFLARVERLKDKLVESDSSSEVISLLHQTIRGVTEDIELLKFNTVISKLMIMCNLFTEVTSINKNDYLLYLQLLAPFATQMTQELWSQLGCQGDIHHSSWPVWDKTLIISSSINIPIQVNGKVRGTVTVAPGATQDQVMQLAQQQEGITKWLEGGMSKIIYIQDKICNIIVQ